MKHFAKLFLLASDWSRNVRTKRMTTKRSTFLACRYLLWFTMVLFKASTGHAQVHEAWVTRYNGASSGADGGAAIAVDNNANVYVAGYSTSTNADFVTAKYNSVGVQQWVRWYNGPGNSSDGATAICVDDSGNVYVTGASVGAGTGQDYATVKYDSAGVQQWVQRYNGPLGNRVDGPSGIAVDHAGNVFVTGSSYGSDTSAYDYLTIKYNSAGVQQWVRRYDGPDGFDDYAYGGIAIDRDGNVIVTGQSEGFKSGDDIVTIKYSSGGTEQWVQRYEGLGVDQGQAIAVDSAGNVFVTGVEGLNLGGDYTTIKYNAAGAQQWVRTYNGPGNSTDRSRAIAVDRHGNVIVTGWSTGAGTSLDYATIKYDAAGVQQWVQRYIGSGNSSDIVYAICVDDSGNVYVTGQVGTGSSGDYVTVKYKSVGTQEWVQRYNGPGNGGDAALAIAVNNASIVFVTGYSYGGITTNNDVATIAYRQGLDITCPRPGERWIAGEQDTIRWAGRQPGQTLLVEYSADSGRTYSTISFGVVADSLLWTFPSTELTTRARIKITDIANPADTAVSDTFKIKGYVLTRYDAIGHYEPFTFGEDRWSFGNTATNMWPQIWWSQFNYQAGEDPYTHSTYPSDEPFVSAPSPFFPDWPLFVQTYGVGSCYWIGWFYDNAATTKWGVMKKMWGGSCSGLALSSILAFDRKGAFRTRYPAVPNFANLISVGLTDSIRLAINELWIHWFGKQHQDFITNQHTRTPTQTINDLKASFLSESQDHSYLYIANNYGTGAHAIVPYKVVDSANTSVYFIQVYDNSYPTTTNARIRVDTARNGGNGLWSYALWPTWGGPISLYMMDPASTYLSPPILTQALSVATPPGKQSGAKTIEVYPTLGASVLIHDALGNAIGVVDSTVIEEIPGAIALTPPTGSETPPYIYRLPRGEYTMRMAEFRDSVSELTLFTDSTIISFKRSDALLPQEDHFMFDGGLSLQSTDTQVKTIRLEMVLIENADEEKVFKLTNCPVIQNDSMYFSRIVNDNMTVRNYGGQKGYGLALERVSSTFKHRFFYPSVVLEANSSHYIAPVWGNLGQPVVIYIDLGNNGTIDDTLIVGNTLGVDEQGSIEVPQEYNLGQNYPNPFNPTTSIQYELPYASHVTLTVYNVLGQQVAMLVEEGRPAGRFTADWNGDDAAGNRVGSGVYFYRLYATPVDGKQPFASVKKMLMLK